MIVRLATQPALTTPSGTWISGKLETIASQVASRDRGGKALGLSRIAALNVV